MQDRWVVALGLVAVMLAACETKTSNPFENIVDTRPPDDDHDIVFTSDNYSLDPPLPSELFGMSQEGASVQRLTVCNRDTPRCHTIEGAVASDRVRAAVRRVVNDTDGDGRLTDADQAGLVVIDMERNIEATVLEDIWDVDSFDWLPLGDRLIFCAVTPGYEREDFYIMSANGTNRGVLTDLPTPTVSERSARVDATGSYAVYERIEREGKAQIYLFASSTDQQQITFGGPGSEMLPGTPYMVGSDANPCFSPDNRFVAFRRLTGIGNGRGTWDILTVSAEDDTVRVVASGPVYRGPPDWGPGGIAFEEPDPGGGSRIAIIEPDTGSLRYPVAVGAGFRLGFPRWIDD